MQDVEHSTTLDNLSKLAEISEKRVERLFFLLGKIYQMLIFIEFSVVYMVQ